MSLQGSLAAHSMAADTPVSVSYETITLMKRNSTRLHIDVKRNTAGLLAKGVGVISESIFSSQYLFGNQDRSFSLAQRILLDTGSSSSRILENYVTRFNTGRDIHVYQFIVSLRHYMLEKIPELVGFPPTELDFAIEATVFPLIHKKAMEYAEEDNKEEDAQLIAQCERYSALTQSQLRIDPELQITDRVPFHRAIATLKSIIFSQMPSRKMQIILSAAQMIYTEIAERNPNAIVGGDQFVDIWIYVVLKARIPSLLTILNFISNFANPELLHGQSGYYFTSVQLAANYIKNLTDSDIPVTNADCECEHPFLVADPTRLLPLIQRCPQLHIGSPFLLAGYAPFVLEDALLDTSRVPTVVLREDANAETEVHPLSVDGDAPQALKELLVSWFTVQTRVMTPLLVRTPGETALAGRIQLLSPDHEEYAHALLPNETLPQAILRVQTLNDGRWMGALTLDDPADSPGPIPSGVAIKRFHLAMQALDAYSPILPAHDHVTGVTLRGCRRLAQILDEIDDNSVRVVGRDLPVIRRMMLQAEHLISLLKRSAELLGAAFPDPVTEESEVAALSVEVRRLQKKLGLAQDGRLGVATISSVLFNARLVKLATCVPAEVHPLKGPPVPPPSRKVVVENNRL
ncbi:Vacuolar sorting protein 9 (VPS9) domain [Carpediemonas membranifera]|uniref:Vacuolar sorting protein 9 (VPS9) domain n=1 Tax=Carpediemonas membranifera TaxID=201153 RepID=A0A8J6BYM4_9EUKA|nr:Vacuolar sorting protein 9 (VPS9) domain [Carpediemonas membranifera]|eukprot:KAG9394656.1 Vacuolar sorting protein 9 (VPS9) domain [Carpediemonas membranifera]